MIIPDKKKMATMIVADMSKPGEVPKEVGDDIYVTLADKIIAAVKDGNTDDLVDALKAFHSECEMDETEE